MYKIFRKPGLRQVFDEMTKALHISEKSPKFTVGYNGCIKYVCGFVAQLDIGKLVK